jgi:hypothetical protein
LLQSTLYLLKSKKCSSRRFDAGLHVEVALIALPWLPDVQRDLLFPMMTGLAMVHGIPLVCDMFPPNHPNPHLTLTDPFWGEGVGGQWTVDMIVVLVPPFKSINRMRAVYSEEALGV